MRPRRPQQTKKQFLIHLKVLAVATPHPHSLGLSREQADRNAHLQAFPQKRAICIF